MCEVCAVFGVGRHWTDATSVTDEKQPAANIARYRDERRQRLRVLGELLRPKGVAITDWDGEAYWVSRDDGRGERAADLTQLWALVERLAGHKFDPLSTEFLPGAP